jgi:superfamily II DNA or RNA helicase
LVRTNQQKNPKYSGANTNADFMRCDLQDLEVKEEYVDTVVFLKEFCTPDFDNSRIQIKICKTDEAGNQQFFHAKSYIFIGDNFAKGIVGSSNFTQKGLEGNSELNYLEWNNMMVTAIPNASSYAKGHLYWFEEKWNLAEPWNKTFLEEVLHGTPVERKAEEGELMKQDPPLTPYELYIKLLNYKFGDIIDLNQQELLASYLPHTYQALDYQMQAVQQCFAIMREHGGFMLADVVGLGKTIVGALIIKHFLTLPEDDGRERKVLVITPPAILSSWRKTIAKFDEGVPSPMEPNIDFVTTGSIGKLVDDEGFIPGEEGATEEGDEFDSGEFTAELSYKNYGLIIIDESHKFRNSQTSMYEALDSLIKQIGSSTGAYPWIGLLSATPQNNRPSDIQNQLYLFERNHADSTLKKANGGNLENYFSEINRSYGGLIAMPKDDDGNPIELTPEERKRRHEELKKLSLSIRQCVLEDILVRRTRTDILKYYPDSGLKFPKISGPHMLEYRMETGLAQLFATTMDVIATQLWNDEGGGACLHYYRYRAIEFLKDPQIKALYKGGNIDPDRFSKQLARIMQMNLVKRIESSFSAFKKSLSNLQQYTQNMIDMWEADTIFICPDLNVNAELDPEKHYAKTHRLCTFEECVEDIRYKIRKLNEKGHNEKQRNRELHRSDFQPDYITLLRRDLSLISYLCKKWSAYSEDPKLECFKTNLRTTLFDPQRNSAHKLVIFSEAVDTACAIQLAIKSVAPSMKVLTITAGNRDKMEETIRENFDANYDGVWKEDYDVIVTTEVLAEGINLHRANCILNYDTPWNSTRLMQRIGRVNRIGSQAPVVYVYNFMPSAQGDAQIQLVQKAHTKLQAFHTLFGEDSQIFDDEEEVTQYDLVTHFDGEESPMEQYISELKEYKEAHPLRFQQIIAKTEGLEMALPDGNGESYFLVRNKRLSGMFVCVDAQHKASILSGADMYQRFKPEKEATAGPLPSDWKERKGIAEKVVNQALTRMDIHFRKSEKATQAKAIITRMKDQLNLSEESLQILADAFQYVNKGNYDIITKMIAIGKELDGAEKALFALQQTDIDTILQKQIGQIVSHVQERYGKAEVYMALSK